MIKVGPNGFPLGFFKKCWTIVKDDVVKFVQEFHHRGKLPRAVTASFISLISKSLNPRGLKKFRPICLVGCLYRLLSKLLVTMMEFVFDKMVSHSQTTFIEGRQLFDGVLVLNEVLDFSKRMRRKCLVLKSTLRRLMIVYRGAFLGM